MRINKAQLLRAVPTLYKPNLDTFVATFNKYSDMFYINTPLRVVHFLAQVFHESANLKYREELASGAAYDTGALAIKLGNTPQKDGDGQKYKGRGYLQLTGKANYQAYTNSGFCIGDVVKNPELLAQSPGDLKSAMWFWYSKKLNLLADRDDVEAVTKRINGGYNGLSNRKYLYRKFKKEFGL